MSKAPTTSLATLADFLHQLGDIPSHRVRFHPLPGTATERDVIAIEARENLLCELVDNALVEKPMGFRESCLASALIALLWAFVQPHNLGFVTGEAGMMRLAPGLVRIPDVAFVSWERLPGRRMPTEPIPNLAPDLAVEVLSESNTAAEMARKCREYFAAGGLLVWLVDPKLRTVDIYTAPDQSVRLQETQTLTGGTVLPGFTLALQDFFAELDRQGGD